MQRASGRIEFANTLRGVAAISVLAFHLLGNFWLIRGGAAHYGNFPVLPPEIKTPSLFQSAFAQPYVDFGQFGVALFFLISGFVIPFSLTRVSRNSFAVGRFWRIYPTYAACFIISLGAFWISASYFSRPYPDLSFLGIAVQFAIGMRPPLGVTAIDPILWTLEIEIYFYVVCYIAANKIAAASRWTFIAPVALAFIAVYLRYFSVPGLQFLGAVAPYLIFMFIGVAFNLAYRGRMNASQLILVASFIFLLFAITLPPSALGTRVFWSYCYALALFWVAFLLSDLFRANTVTTFFANISYPLYATHAALGFVLTRIALDLNFNKYIAAFGVIAVLCVISWVVHVLIERPTQILGRKIGKKLSSLETTSRRVNISDC